MQSISVKSMSRDELRALASKAGQPEFRGDQIYRWLYASGVRSFDEMTNLPGPFREWLEVNAHIEDFRLVTSAVSTDGTVKYLCELASGNRFETVLIPDLDKSGNAKRITVCVSSQVGCAMACSFCATGTMGFLENIPAGLIVDQVMMVDRESQTRFGRGVTNVVFMGMGEPMLNFRQVSTACRILTDSSLMNLSHRRVTVSTVGLAKQIRQLADEGIPASLAVSLHAPDDTKRSSIMPVNRSVSTDLGALRDAIRHYSSVTGKSVTYEYCMFRGFNDSKEDARRLAQIVGWAPSKVNLIMYNPVPDKEFQPTGETALNSFISILVDSGVTVTVRRSRGQDIAAACGQLATRFSDA